MKPKKYIPEIQKRPYRKKKRCHNCKGFTDSWGQFETHYYCQKCLIWRKTHKKVFPTKQTINDLKEVGRWKR